MSTEDPITADPGPRGRRARAAGRAGGLRAQDEDRALLERGDDALDAEADARPAAGRGRRRPPERRQVDPGQPDHRPPRGRRRGRPRRHPRPRRLRRRVGRAARSPLVDTGGWEHRRHAASTCASPSRPRSPSTSPTSCSSSSTPRSAPPTTDETVVKLLRRAGKPVVLVANKVDDQRTEADAAALWSLGLGEPWPGLGAARARERRPARRAPRGAARGLRHGRGLRARRPAPGRAARPPERRQVLAAQQAGRRRSGSSSTTSPAPPATRSTSWSSSAARRGASSTPPASGAACTRPAGADFYASLRTQTALEKAEVAVVLVDAARADHRAGRPRHPAGRRRRPRPGHRLQQVGPHRRGAPPLPRARDRARPRAGPVGAAGQRLGPHRPAHGQARAGARDRARRRGRPASRPAGSTPSSARSSRRTRTRCAAASSRASCSRTQAGDPPAAVRAVRDRLPRGRLPPLHRAPPARGVRLRGHADRDLGAGAREALPPLTLRRDAVTVVGDSVASARMG